MPACKATINTITGSECLKSSIVKINNNFNTLEQVVTELKERVDKNKQIRTFFYYGPNADTSPTSGMDDSQLSRPSNATIAAFVNSPSQLNLPTLSNPGDVAYVIYQKTGFVGTAPGTTVNYNPTTGGSATYTAGNKVTLLYNKWYNVDDYFSALAYSDGSGARVGTITLTFRTPENKTQQFTYAASGQPSKGDDTYVEWNQSSVIWSEGYPIPKTLRGTASRPFLFTKGVQFLFTISGEPVSRGIEAYTKISSRSLQVIPKFTAIDLTTLFKPIFIIWKLNYIEKEYVVELGFPKFSSAFTSDGVNNSNWNQPQNWATYNSWM